MIAVHIVSNSIDRSKGQTDATGHVFR